MRLVLALERVPHEVAVLESALVLAKWLDTAIDALLVQSEELTRYAMLPFAREIDLRSGEARLLNVNHLERAWSAERRRLEAWFQASASARAVRFSIEATRGDLMQALLMLSTETESVALAVIGGLGQFPRLAKSSAALRSRRECVAVYVDQSTEAPRALEMAIGIAAATARDLIVVHGDAATELPHALENKAVQARVITTRGHDVADLVDALPLADVAVVVLPASQGAQLPKLAQALIGGPERLIVLAR